MPTTEAIVWTAIGSLILVMLGIIGYLISNGFTSLKDQLKSMWLEMSVQRSLASVNASAIVALQARCEERHANHKRADD